MRTVPIKKRASKAVSEQTDGLAIKGVAVLGFKPDSIAEKTGMQKGDIIVEYHGVENLTTQMLPELAAMEMPAGMKARVVIVRDGKKRLLKLPPGSLGVSAMDATIHGPLKNPETDPELNSSIERLVQFIMSELADGTGKRRLRRTLLNHGWDKNEATQFISQVDREMGRYPNIRALLKEYQSSAKWAALVLTLIAVLYAVDDIAFFDGDTETVLWLSFLALVTVVGLVSIFWKWLMDHRRLRSKTAPAKNPAIVFKPTKGSLFIEKPSPSRAAFAFRILGRCVLIIQLFFLAICLAMMATILASLIGLR